MSTRRLLAGLFVAHLSLLAHHGIGWRATRLLTGACAAGTLGALVVCGVMVEGPLRHGPADVSCDPSGSCRQGLDLVR